MQHDGVAWQQVVYGDTVYVGGLFKTARPAGSSPGTNTVPRSNMLAFNINTGELIKSFVADTNGQVYGMSMAPDGKKLYISGEFTKVNGVTRNRIAAVDPITGAVDLNFKAGADYRVRSVVATENAVYAAGKFNSANGHARRNLVAFSRTDGSVLKWAPKANNGQVMALAMVPKGDRIVVGGSFNNLTGVEALGLGAVDLDTGAVKSFPANQVIKNGTDEYSAIYSLHADETMIYGTGYTWLVRGAKGNYEGTFATDAVGNIVWMNDSRGDTYDVFSARGMVFTAGHAHRMGNVENGFPERDNNTPTTSWPALAMTQHATGVLAPGTTSYNFGGRPSPTLLHFYPQLNGGSFTGMSQATWTVGGNDKYLVFGGEFPRAGGVAQQGLVRYAFKDVDPRSSRPEFSGADFVPDVTAPAAGVAQVSWRANWDRDDEVLTYSVEREGSGVIANYRVRSTHYERPIMTHLDESLKPGQQYRYRIAVRDSTGNVNNGDWVSVTVRDSGTLSPYARTVLDDRPQTYRRLGGNTEQVVDSAYTYNGVVSSGVTRGVPGAIVGDANTAYRFNGGQRATLTDVLDTPRAMSSEAWIRTTAKNGGMIVGWGDRATGASKTLDYVTYMGKDGKVRFAIDERGLKVLTSPTALNDGKWHHVVATLDWWTGQRLFIDGALVAEDRGARHANDFYGNWRIGGDSLAGLPGKGSDNFTGDIDEVATYLEALPASRVKAHYTVGTGGDRARVNRLPVAKFQHAVSDLTVTLDGSQSFDPDGTVAAYQWSLGDGTTLDGPTPTWTYALSGTYRVWLTVTDDKGVSVTTSQDVTVAAPLVPGTTFIADDFTRLASMGWGTAPVGGDWTHTGGLSNFWVDGERAIAAVAPGLAKRAMNGIPVADVDVLTAVSLDAAPTGGGVYISLGARSSAAGAYTVRTRFLPDGMVTLYMHRIDGGVMSTLGVADLAGVTYVPGQKLNIRFMVAGTGTTILQAKAWPEGAPEPEAWTVVATDITPALQEAGTVYLENYTSASSLQPAGIAYDAISVTPLS